MNFRGMLLLLLAAACSPKPADRSSDTIAVAVDTVAGAGGHDMAGRVMTGDADRDFLRMMSDHHKGLIALAHESMLQGGRGTAQSQVDAQVLDARQDRELEQMVTMLVKYYQDPHQPAVTLTDQALIDSVLATSGPAYASAFYRFVAAHHRQAATMIDAYLPRAGRADLKALAERMRSDHLAEIKEFERKAGSP